MNVYVLSTVESHTIEHLLTSYENITDIAMVYYLVMPILSSAKVVNKQCHSFKNTHNYA